MISRRVDLELTVKVPFRRLVADDVKVNGVVEDERPFPAQQDGAVLLASEIRDGWR